MSERARKGRPGPGSRAEGDDDVPFEDMMRRLEGIVQRLERGELSLEESLAAYEEGIGLVRAAKARLDALDGRLERLTESGETAPLSLGDGGGAGQGRAEDDTTS